jgi:hypothetical protein
MFVCVEMQKHGIAIEDSDEKRRMLPHPSQDSPVLGLTIYSHGYTCSGCQFSHQNLPGMGRHCSCTRPKSQNWISTPVQTFAQFSYQRYFPLPGHQLPSLPTAQVHIVDGPEAVMADTAVLLRQHKEKLASQLQESEDESQDDLRNIPPCLVNLSIHSFLKGFNETETEEFYTNVRVTWHDFHPHFKRLHSLVQATLDADCDLCDPVKRSTAGLVVAHHITNSSQGYVYCGLDNRINTDVFQINPA